ncbi:C39 family peptidase [Parasporobacterium paucivorans]|uniref:Peptidase_C39 like family protein n=1 Tax=Parasporobacterium paucivorans DSM 15970 TaxID=1122934 RepID=A0A1M6I5N3_9FIRM|nr:C39 family peptidase [Parasporobacterium paucivorans]SHJ29777.1 Peptidase_C39 like family protein [Parasporobacterium paucivorans DSM 15970]
MFKKSFRPIFFLVILGFFTFFVHTNPITSLSLTREEKVLPPAGAVEILPVILGGADFLAEAPDFSHPEEPCLPTSLGSLIYYNQQDARWAGYLYGGADPLYEYGCGPTVVSMVVSSFTGTPMNPAEMAQWASDHSYWAPGSGSFHALIPGALSAFGLKTESIPDHSPQNIVSLLESGKILIALMDKGHFTRSGGHFIILAGISSDGRILVADPNNAELTTQTWDPALISSEIRLRAGDGGPLWAVSR